MRSLKIPDDYRPIPVRDQIRWSILERAKRKMDIFPYIQGREETKREVAVALLSGAHIYLVSQEGTGKTRMAKGVASLLLPVLAIKGCPYHDDPLWPKEKMCPMCRTLKNPAEELGIEIIPGFKRFSRIQGNEYVNESKLIGFKDIQKIIEGKSPKDPGVFVGTGIPRANRGILFVDELPAIRTKIQVIFHPVLEEGKFILEEYGIEVSVDTIVLATGNPEGFSHVNEVPRPLLDRLELVPMPMPDEDEEKKIALLEAREEYKEQEEMHSTLISISPPERNVLTPWWIINTVVKAVRGSRECPRLDRKASIRATISALKHTGSSAELSGRSVPNFMDALTGVKLSLRGRVTLKPEYINFEDPEKNFAEVDRISEDLLAMAIWEEGQRFLRSFPEADRSLESVSSELSLFVKKLQDEKQLSITSLPPALRKMVELLLKLEDNRPHDVSDELILSAMDFIANILYRGGKLEHGIKKFFNVPRLYKEGNM